MSLITRIRREKCVWWKQKGRDIHGQPLFEPGEEVDCRWESTTRYKITDEGGQKRDADMIYLDNALGVTVGDYLQRIEEEELTNMVVPPADARRVMETKRIPKMRFNETLFYALV